MISLFEESKSKGKLYTFTAQEHFHNGESVSFKVPATQLRIADKMILLSGKKISELNKKLCGVANCSCGGLERATITDKYGHTWNFMQSTRESEDDYEGLFEDFVVEAKAPSFSTYVRDTYKILSSIKDFSVKRKLSFGHDAGKESANFAIFKHLGNYNEKNKTELQDEYREVGNKIKKTILQTLYHPTGNVNSKQQIDYEFNRGAEIESQTINFTDTKNGYNVKVTYRYHMELWSAYVSFDVEITGAAVASQQITFTEFPEFVPGTILHSSWGYSMTINSYYEIVRRTNKTVFAVEIGKVKVDGDGWTGHEEPNPKAKGKEVFSGRLTKGGYVKLDGHLCRVWSGKPDYYNSLD